MPISDAEQDAACTLDKKTEAMGLTSRRKAEVHTSRIRTEEQLV